jgi:hypothetical protein
MIQREELTNQIPANATALKTAKILLPEGASKNFRFAWVCDAKGGLYLSVNKDHMISCGPGSIDLAKTLMIKGAKPVRCETNAYGCCLALQYCASMWCEPGTIGSVTSREGCTCRSTRTT